MVKSPWVPLRCTHATATAGAAASAAFVSLTSQATVTLINNKGDISKTLNDLASSDTVRSLATAAITAGVAVQLGFNPSELDTFSDKLTKGITAGFTNAVADTAINGTSFEDALQNSLRSSLVDVLAAQTFTSLVKPIDADTFALNLTHKLVAAGVGCVTAEAKQQSCDAGALGAAVGESIADYYITPEIQTLINLDLMPASYLQELTNKIKLATGTIAALTNTDVDVAVKNAVLAVENNGYYPNTAEKVELNESALLVYAGLTSIILTPVAIAEATARYNNATTNKEKALILVELGIPVAKAQKIATQAKKITVKPKLSVACFVAGTLIETIDGLRSIETINEGDLVWSRHEETLEYGYRPVTATSIFDDKAIYEVVVKNQDGKIETYQTTEEHPFWVVDSGWLAASRLEPEMVLVDRDN